MRLRLSRDGAGQGAAGEIAELAEAVQAGYPTVKIFTTDITPSRKGRMVDFGDIWEVFKVLAQGRRHRASIHAEDNDIVMHMYDKLFREGRTGFENMAEVHNTLSEDLSFRRVIRLAENVSGHRALHDARLSARIRRAAIREARARGLPIYGETLHQYLLYTPEDYKRPNGQIYHTYPSLKSAEDQEALWAGTLRRRDQTRRHRRALLHAARSRLQGKRIDDTTGGNAGVEPRVALMYTEMVGSAATRWSTSSTSSRPMRRGSWAFIRAKARSPPAAMPTSSCSIRRRRTVRAQDLHEADYTPWEGHEVTPGRP